MRHAAEPDAVSELAHQVAIALLKSGRRTALRCAMDKSEVLLREPTDALRTNLRKQVLRAIPGVGYQGEDFESIDYDMYEISPDLPLFRGPPVDAQVLARGEYFCVLGAAQTFGRLVHHSWPHLVSEAVGLPVVNLGRGGKGPEFFLHPVVLEIARKARFVIIQAMSGRSVGCEEYPGGRYITRGSERTKVQRWTVLEQLWNKDRKVAIDYVGRWNASYLDLYARLHAQIGRPALLAWISERAPDGWSPQSLLQELDWGMFPQLVGQDLYQSVAALFDAHVELVFKRESEQLMSRSTGNPCPYFGSGKQLKYDLEYYPTSEANTALATKVIPWARKALENSGGSQ